MKYQHMLTVLNREIDILAENNREQLSNMYTEFQEKYQKSLSDDA